MNYGVTYLIHVHVILRTHNAITLAYSVFTCVCSFRMKARQNTISLPNGAIDVTELTWTTSTTRSHDIRQKSIIYTVSVTASALSIQARPARLVSSPDYRSLTIINHTYPDPFRFVLSQWAGRTQDDGVAVSALFQFLATFTVR